MSKWKKGSKGITMLTVATSLVLLAGCADKESAEVDDEPSDGVVVNNGQIEESSKDTYEKEVNSAKDESEDSGEVKDSEESMTKREVTQDKIPTTTRETLSWGEELSGEPTDTLTSTSDSAPDLSQEYVTVNAGNPETVDFSVPYTLYFQDDNKRSVGGEGVVQLNTLTERPSMKEGEDTTLYPMQMLSTNLLGDERGKEERNYVQVTKQAYNLMTELNQNIYDTVKNTQSDNHVYLSMEALYTGEDTIPYGVHYQVQSVHGDIKFNYIINNIQSGQKVNYIEGTLEEGEGDE